MHSVIKSGRSRSDAHRGDEGTGPPGAGELGVLEQIQNRVLWLATRIVHEANKGPSGASAGKSKVGGHQASSASVVSILTALYFGFLRAGDRVAVKPHASPAFHAVQYLLGRLESSHLKTLRRFGGLQAYPSRTKDPDPVDFSTGSVGLGAAAPAFAALTEHYARDHFGPGPKRRFVAIIGDAELDEGNIWEAVTEDHLQGLGNLIWIVDLNRQSLDRVIPGIRAAQLEAIFGATDWHVVEVKYGRRLKQAFRRQGGEALRRRIDRMSNQEYQATIRLEGADCRRCLLDASADVDELKMALADVPDDEVTALLSDLGGHDLAELLRALDAADARDDRPTVIFAYTIKGWGLPIAGHPLNHSMLLSQQQIDDLRLRLNIPEDDDWARFPDGSPENERCLWAAQRLNEPSRTATRASLSPASIPESLGHKVLSKASTQQTLGQLLYELAENREVAPRIVTVAPDVAVSTNLGGWINKMGVYSAKTMKVYDPVSHAIQWRPSPQGQHIELGISEMNMFLLLGQLGLADELIGEQLIPIGTVYDPFVLRGLDAFIYGLYSNARFIIAGTPSGLSLGPEGGAHQSTVTPSIGIGLPNLVSYEPAFAREVEWILLSAIRQCLDRDHGKSTYLRLSTKSVDQTLLDPVLERLGEKELRRQVLAGGYRLVDHALDAPQTDPSEVVQIAVAGALVPEAAAAARALHAEGVAANVLVITSADRLYATTTARRRARGQAASDLERQLAPLLPQSERRAPIVTVIDGASHVLTFLGGLFGVPVVPLGVDEFGQSGTTDDLYRHYEIDCDAIVSAAFRALDLK